MSSAGRKAVLQEACPDRSGSDDEIGTFCHPVDHLRCSIPANHRRDFVTIFGVLKHSPDSSGDGFTSTRQCLQCSRHSCHQSKITEWLLELRVAQNSMGPSAGEGCKKPFTFSQAHCEYCGCSGRQTNEWRNSVTCWPAYHHFR
jgi:hypothetical protein